jgi:23S rRNA (guanosine2251-2'-O)-methyltransferase
MTAALFQIRVCQNPDCGLRYPLTYHATFGDRCPVCLSQTSVALEKSLDRESLFEKEINTTRVAMHVVLDNVRSAWNVGSILRSADGFEFRHVHLCGITPTPETSGVRKTALGAEKYVNWSAHKNALDLAGSLKEQDFQIWALEQTQDSIPIDRAVFLGEQLRAKVLVVGNEVTGVDPGILEIADMVVHVPMRGRKRSFNVGVAFAIAAHTMCWQVALRE